jgi:twitching motility protein PilT
VSAQLEQIIGYLDRDGVTEVVISVGRPIAMRQNDSFVNLTARPLSPDQLLAILRGTAVASMVPDSDGTGEPAEVDIGNRRARVQVGRRGEQIVVRFEKPRPAARRAGTSHEEPFGIPRTPAEGRVPAAIETRARQPEPRPRSSTGGPEVSSRPRTPSSGAKYIPTPRAKSPTALTESEPRSKSPSNGPRTKAPTKSPATAPRSKGSTNAPRTKGAATRTKAPSGAPKSPPAAETSMDLELGTLSGGRAQVVAPPATLDVDLGTLSGSSPGDLEMGAGLSLELDPADVRAAIDPHDLLADARPTWDAAAVPASRDTPMPIAARRAMAAAETTPVLGVASQPVLDGGPLARIVQRARERGASDLHVASGRPISIRVGGELVALDAQPLAVEAAEAMLLPLLDGALRAQLERLGYADLAVPLAAGGRLRANLTRSQAGIKGTFRLALPEPPTLDQLGLPKELAKVVGHHQGLVVIAGPSGHGKTTTLAALVDLVNASKPHHILTVEDPIEIVYPRKAAVVSQREAGRHTRSFATALKASLREDPDVIVIGELRDRETVEIALTASETGHLVLATMSTPSAAKTIDRLIDMFPPDEHTQVRASIAGALRAIVAQRLMPTRDGKVAAAIELVTGVLPLAVLIRDDKLYQLPNLMQRGKAFGMIRFDDSLLELVRAGKISEDTALAAASSKTELAAALKRPA